MTKFKQKECVTCGAKQHTNLDECISCRQKRQDDESQKLCALCDARIPPRKGRANSKYCSRECSGLVNAARTGLSVANDVARHIKHGHMKPARTHQCVDCGAPAKTYDHREYLKPLQVDPVCKRCNFVRGPTADIKEFVAKHLDVSLDRLAETLKEMCARKDVEIARRHNLSLALGQRLVDLHEARCGSGAKRK